MPSIRNELCVLHIIRTRGVPSGGILLLGAMGLGVLVWDFSVCLSVCLFVPGGAQAADPPLYLGKEERQAK